MQCLLTYGFNEAPIHESGKSARLGQGSATEFRFNEAPIHESGKLGREWIGIDLSESFNEAPIHESGKYGSARIGRIGQKIASMRPRFMNRGSPTGRAPRRPRSRRFNEAPIHESGKFTRQNPSVEVLYGFNEAPIHESGKSRHV